jgi:hypothetical protein
MTAGVSRTLRGSPMLSSRRSLISASGATRSLSDAGRSHSDLPAGMIRIDIKRWLLAIVRCPFDDPGPQARASALWIDELPTYEQSIRRSRVGDKAVRSARASLPVFGLVQG